MKTIDILIPVAEKGGVENVILAVSRYLTGKGWKIRIIQFIWEGVRWVDEGLSFCALLEGRSNHTLDEIRLAYKKYLQEEGCANIILAATWPYTSYIAKKCLLDLNLNAKVLSWLHGPLNRYLAAGFGDATYLNCADAHLAISDSIANEIQNSGISSPVFRVHNPVDFSRLHYANTNTNPDHINKLLFVGRISPEKNIEKIISAFSIYSENWELHIVGSGDSDYEKKLRLLVNQKNLNQKIVWHGWSSTPWDVVPDADAFVLASVYEGFPLAAIEAAYTGLPVISTAVSGIIELIQPGINGYLFDTPEMLASILKGISNHIFPSINPECCRQKVLPFEHTAALEDFNQLLLDILEVCQAT